MSSFTPLYNPALSSFQPGFFPWMPLDTWKPNPLMMFALQNIQVRGEKVLQMQLLPKKTVLATQYSPVQEQYEPERQIQGFQAEEKKSGGRIQCRGRNDFSNILKAFIHLIKTSTALKEKAKCIISLKQLPLTYERFFMRIRRKFSKGKTYISPKEITNFMNSCNQTNDQSEKAIGLVFRIILKSFLSLEYLLCLIKNFKGKKQSKKDLITKTRQLSKLIFQEILESQAE